MSGSFYAVAKGRNVGVFRSWDECNQQVREFKGAQFKKFSSLELAEQFLAQAPSGPSEDVPLQDSGEAGRAFFPTAGPPSRKRLLSPPSASSTQLGPSQTVRELHTLRKTVEDLGTSIAEFVEAKGKELSAVKLRIEELLRGQETGPVADGREDDVGSSRKKLKANAFSGSAEKNLLVQQGFSVDDDGFVHVYTDGACGGNGYAGAKAGVGVWWNHDHMLNVAAPVSKGQRHTNNVAEIQAAIEAIKLAKASNVTKLCINTDSKFMIDCMTKWISGWRKNGWQTQQREPVKNKDELVVLDTLLSSDRAFQVRWNHVRGHAGVEGNERADELARQGANK